MMQQSVVLCYDGLWVHDEVGELVQTIRQNMCRPSAEKDAEKDVGDLCRPSAEK